MGVRKTKFFLAQHLVEIDITDRHKVDDLEVHSYLSEALKLLGRDKKHRTEVYRLAVKPYSYRDVVVESYEYRGYPIKIYQDANTVGGNVPSYFSTTVNIHTKSKSEGVVADSEDIEEVRKAAERSVDYMCGDRSK